MSYSTQARALMWTWYETDIVWLSALSWLLLPRLSLILEEVDILIVDGGRYIKQLRKMPSFLKRRMLNILYEISVLRVRCQCRGGDHNTRI